MKEDEHVSALRVDIDANGRRTLSLVRGPDVSAPLDGDLRGNDDAARFYRAVAARLALFAATGMRFTYQDADA